jgi:hypothetical protein
MTDTAVRMTANELATQAAASVDPSGTRFDHDGRVLRALRGSDASFIRSLLDKPGLESAFDAGLVRFSLCDIQVDGADVVIEAERVPVVTYPQEWPTVVLHEAGQVIARIGRALTPIGAGLRDAHPWNVLFHGTKAVWVDVGSLVPAGPVSRSWVDEFFRHVALPLELRARGWHSMADIVWKDHPGTGMKSIWARRPLSQLIGRRYRHVARKAADPAAFFAALEVYMTSLRPASVSGEWSAYVQAPGATVGQREAYDPKQLAVDAFLSDLRPGTALDVGANAGWFSELAAWRGHAVVALDTDDVTLGRLYRRAQRQGLSILPLRLDVMWPTGSHGLALAHSAAPERLRSDTSLWLAVLHHLVGRQGYSFELVARVIDRFTHRTAIVEFVPREDRFVRDWPVAADPSYHVEGFIESMRPYFPRVA